jgi:hypothetical protein
MISNPLVTKIVQYALIPAVPSVAQFASSVVTKCVTYGVSCAIGATLSPQIEMNPLTTLRGGANGNLLDLERVDLRLSSLEQYCVVASIILGAVIGKRCFWFTVGLLSFGHLKLLLSFAYIYRYLWRYT